MDTGAARTLMSYKDYELAFSEPRPKIMPSQTELRRLEVARFKCAGKFVSRLSSVIVF